MVWVRTLVRRVWGSRAQNVPRGFWTKIYTLLKSLKLVESANTGYSESVGVSTLHTRRSRNTDRGL